MKFLTLIVVFVFGASAAYADDAALARAAAAIVGCEIEQDGSAKAALANLPHSPDGVQIVATLSSAADGSMGDLCVGLVKPQGQEFTKIAGLPSDSETIEVPSFMSPLSGTSIGFDPVSFRYAPDREAFGVRVSGYYTSTSTHASGERLYLFYKNGQTLDVIFDADMGTETESNINGVFEAEASTATIIYFDKIMHKGVYDLILSDKKHKKRYVWMGSRYSDKPVR